MGNIERNEELHEAAIESRKEGKKFEYTVSIC